VLEITGSKGVWYWAAQGGPFAETVRLVPPLCTSAPQRVSRKPSFLCFQIFKRRWGTRWDSNSTSSHGAMAPSNYARTIEVLALLKFLCIINS